MDFLEAQNYLEKVRSQKGIVLGLDTMRHLMAKLNNPQDKVKFIQIAGTNGKGSTAAYLTSILSEAGIKVGRYTSPAVFSSTEQYFACGSCISESEYFLLGSGTHTPYAVPSIDMMRKVMESGNLESDEKPLWTDDEAEMARICGLR